VILQLSRDIIRSNSEAFSEINV